MKVDRNRVYEKCNDHCGYCGKKLETIKDMQVDHIDPQWRAVTKEQKDRINAFDNLMPSCRRCNHYKRSDNLEQFRRKMATLHNRVCDHYIGKVAIDFGMVDIRAFDGKFHFEKQ